MVDVYMNPSVFIRSLGHEDNGLYLSYEEGNKDVIIDSDGAHFMTEYLGKKKIASRYIRDFYIEERSNGWHILFEYRRRDQITIIVLGLFKSYEQSEWWVEQARKFINTLN